jgi:hypothetical protein
MGRGLCHLYPLAADKTGNPFDMAARWWAWQYASGLYMLKTCLQPLDLHILRLL